MTTHLKQRFRLNKSVLVSLFIVNIIENCLPIKYLKQIISNQQLGIQSCSIVNSL